MKTTDTIRALYGDDAASAVTRLIDEIYAAPEGQKVTDTNVWSDRYKGLWKSLLATGGGELLDATYGEIRTLVETSVILVDPKVNPAYASIHEQYGCCVAIAGDDYETMNLRFRNWWAGQMTEGVDGAAHFAEFTSMPMEHLVALVHLTDANGMFNLLDDWSIEDVVRMPVEFVATIVGTYDLYLDTEKVTKAVTAVLNHAEQEGCVDDGSRMLDMLRAELNTDMLVDP